MFSFQEVDSIVTQVLTWWEQNITDRRIHLAISPSDEQEMKISYLVSNCQNAREAIQIIFYLVLEKHFGRTVEIDYLEIKESFAESAYNFRYEGRWNIVQNLLEVPDTINHKIAALLQQMHPREIFGNLLPRSKRMFARVRVKFHQNAITDTRPVKKKVFRRGYDDKGHLRPKHLARPVGLPQITPEPTKQDRRNKVIYFDKPALSFINKSRTGLFPNISTEGGIFREQELHRPEKAIC